MTGTQDHSAKWLHSDRIPYHESQFKQVYRSTVHLGRFIRGVAPDLKGEALDVACGAGANIFHLSDVVGPFRWTGVDLAGESLYEIGAPYFSQKPYQVSLLTGNLYNLDAIFPDRQFDMVLLIQTLLALPDPYEAMRQLLRVTRGWLFITSLFTEFDVDLKVEAFDYLRAPDCRGPFSYNVFGLGRFRAFCESLGVVEFRVQDFEIDIELPRPTATGMATYTERLADKRLLQFSGPLFMPWKFVALRKG